LINDRNPTLCDKLGAINYARSRVSWKASRNTVGNACAGSKKNIHIFERYIGFWFMVSHK
jgi:hypothetical protein